MPITLEQVEFLKQKAGLNYEEAVELMEKAGGDLLRALKILEDNGQLAFTPLTKKAGQETFWSRLWEINKAARIRVNRPEGTLFQFPLALGIAGAAAFPRLTSWSMLVLLLTRCSLEIHVR
ncbi:MAG TPA: DUF4342 domain-containing protein [Firmicutes bacterium]|jgi:hypothetical protein|nr:DUF4342 domain-containing protein [Bacillota bacterium]